MNPPRLLVKLSNSRITGDIMDKKADDDGRMTPLERIKADHEILRALILDNYEDEIDWEPGTQPQQVGLQFVMADENDNLWVVREEDGKLKLKRLCQ